MAGGGSDYKSRQPRRRAGGLGAAEGGAGLGCAQISTAAPRRPRQPLGSAGSLGRPAAQRPAPPRPSALVPIAGRRDAWARR